MADDLRLIARHWYIGDIDRAGDTLDSYAAADDLEGFRRASQSITQNLESITRWAIDNGGVVHLAIADEFIIESRRELAWAEAPLRSFGWCWSIGHGRSFATAHSSLAVAKSRGGNRTVTLIGDYLDEVHDPV